jgi:hypothetical protein
MTVVTTTHRTASHAVSRTIPSAITNVVLRIMIIATGLPTAAGAKVFTRVSAEGGQVQYDLKADQGNGWYSEPSSA